MSTDPTYPEVSGDESGIVPPQSGRSPEWPKKIRTLTASELDRLTIDGSGRFYWDGKLVNYEPPQPKEPPDKSPEAREQSAMDIIDRAAHELSDRRNPEPIEGAELPHADAPAQRDEPVAVDLDLVPPAEEAVAAAEAVGAGASHVIRSGDQVRVKLSKWQSFGAIIVVLGIATGALGVAAYGFVAAHEWGCRTGLIQSHCPAMQAARPASRSDIPA
jgi:hypothetical protein